MKLLRLTLVIQLACLSCTPENDVTRRFDIPVEDVLIDVSEHKLTGDTHNPLLGASDIKWIDKKFYLASGWQNMIFQFDEAGNLQKKIGNAGRGPCDFNLPTRLMISGNNISVLEAGNNRIQVLSTEFDCGEILNLPFLPADATYNDVNRSYRVLGSLFSSDSPKFVHVIDDGQNISQSFINTPDELIFDYYSTNFDNNLIWGNNNSRFFNLLNIETGENREFLLLDTMFVSIFEELVDFELKEQDDLRTLMRLTRQIPHSNITGAIYKRPYLLISYQQKNTDQPNRLLIQDLDNDNILFTTTIGEYNILENRVDDNVFLLYKYNDEDLGSVDVKIVELNVNKLNYILNEKVR